MKIVRLSSVAVLALMALIALAPGAYAVVLAPGTSAAPTNFAAGFIGAVQADTGIVPFLGIDATTATVFQGNLREQVVTDTVTGNLDFIYQIQRTIGVGTDAIRRMTTTDYAAVISAGVSPDVGYCSACADLLVPIGGHIAPTSVDLSANGRTVGFDMSLGGADETYLLVIKTNAKSYLLGSTQVIDGAVASVLTFAPAPEPGSIGLLLGSLFGIGLFAARRFRVSQS